MPQKKNPDVRRARARQVRRASAGHVTALLMLMKGQPLAYNKDNQEDKEPLFDTVDTLADVARDRGRPRRDGHHRQCRSACAPRRAKAIATATDLADYLVRKGVPFRDAHEVAGALVSRTPASWSSPREHTSQRDVRHPRRDRLCGTRRPAAVADPRRPRAGRRRRAGGRCDGRQDGLRAGSIPADRHDGVPVFGRLRDADVRRGDARADPAARDRPRAPARRRRRGDRRPPCSVPAGIAIAAILGGGHAADLRPAARQRLGRDPAAGDRGARPARRRARAGR